MATKEDRYKSQLIALGIYEEAYDPAIHELCVLEREISRARKQLKDTAADGKAPSYADPLYGVVRQLQTNILAYRDALGLTPKSLKKLKGQAGSSVQTAVAQSPLEVILSRHGKNRGTNTEDQR